MTLYWAANGAMPTTAPYTGYTSGSAGLTTPRTLLQIATPSTKGLKVVKWGVQFAAVLTAPVVCELIETGTVACTGLTAHVAAGVQPYGADALGCASDMTLGTGATGYATATAGTEGSITATRQGDFQILPVGAAQWTWEWSFGREFAVGPSRFLRVRVSTATAVTVSTFVIWDE